MSLRSDTAVQTLFSLEGLELGRIEVERLLALEEKFAREGLSFDDVSLIPAESEVLPNDVSTRTRLTRELELAIPVVSAAMDTVTEARLAIALARSGGIGVVHRNLSIEDQVAEVDKVKRSEAGMIVEPVTLPPGRSGRRRARADGALPHLRRPDHRRRRDPRRDPDQPRPPLRERHEPADQRADDRDRARHRTGRDDARRGRADPPPQQGREAPRRRCRRRAAGA